MNLPFTHRGQTRTLAKHPSVVRALKLGTLTAAQAARKRWFLRVKIDGLEKYFKLPAADEAAKAAARDLLNGRVDKPEAFSAFLAHREAARGVTIGELADAWLALGCPKTPSEPRTEAEAGPLRGILSRCLFYWRPRRVSGITPKTFHDYCGARCAQVAGRAGATPAHFTGRRSVDQELTALSSLCQWAVFDERIKTNPFAQRPPFQKDKEIRHCSDFMPDNDEHLHTILRWLWRDPTHTKAILAGGDLAFGALSGLRPGETGLLQLLPPLAHFPTDMDQLPPGLIYPLPDGTRRMVVRRLKGGQNPAVVLHPALSEFLDVWKSWLNSSAPSPISHLPSPIPLFPLNAEAVSNHLARAVAATGGRTLHPHGFGRAYYVRVRRSQGMLDPAIAVELGHNSNGQLIRKVYGSPRDPVGGNLHDWLPTDQPPAWELLKPQQTSNLITL